MNFKIGQLLSDSRRTECLEVYRVLVVVLFLNKRLPLSMNAPMMV